MKHKKLKDYDSEDIKKITSSKEYIKLTSKLEREELESIYNVEDVDKYYFELNKKAKILKGESKVLKIEFNKVIYKSPEDASKKHTEESRKKLSIARRKRKKQPREGTSKKAQNFYDQLFKEYNLKRLKKTSQKEVNEFLEEKKDVLKNIGLNEGVYTDYYEQSHSFNKVSVDEVAYDPQQKQLLNFEEDIDYKIDYDIFLKDLEENISWYKQDGMSDHFVESYSDFRNFQFKLERMSLKEKEYKQILKEYILDNFPQYEDYFL